MPKYSRAPITEAVIDVRVSRSEPVPIHVLQEIARAEKASYSESTLLQELETEIEAGKELKTRAKRTLVGVGIKASNGLFIAQLRVNGFICSRLAPYDSWEEFAVEAKRLWSAYRRHIGPASFRRVAVRFINRLDLPPGREFSDFVRTYPQLSPDLPQAMEGYFLQMAVPDGNSPRRLLLHEALVPSPVSGRVGLILDIDLFQETALPLEDDGLWELLESLRIRKNQIFEACITETTREMIR